MSLSLLGSEKTSLRGGRRPTKQSRANQIASAASQPRNDIRWLAMTIFFVFPIYPLLHAAEPVRVHVTVLTASNEGTDFDLDNDAYRDRLIELFSYSSYTQLDQWVMDLDKGVRQKAVLPEGYQLILTLQEREQGRVMIQALIRKGTETFVDTILAIARPGVVFLGGPPAARGVFIIVLENHL